MEDAGDAEALPRATMTAGTFAVGSSDGGRGDPLLSVPDKATLVADVAMAGAAAEKTMSGSEVGGSAGARSWADEGMGKMRGTGAQGDTSGPARTGAAAWVVVTVVDM